MASDAFLSEWDADLDFEDVSWRAHASAADHAAGTASAAAAPAAGHAAGTASAAAAPAAGQAAGTACPADPYAGVAKALKQLQELQMQRSGVTSKAKPMAPQQPSGPPPTDHDDWWGHAGWHQQEWHQHVDDNGWRWSQQAGWQGPSDAASSSADNPHEPEQQVKTPRRARGGASASWCTVYYRNVARYGWQGATEMANKAVGPHR